MLQLTLGLAVGEVTSSDTLMHAWPPSGALGTVGWAAEAPVDLWVRS
jgi:hypothetical protein